MNNLNNQSGHKRFSAAFIISAILLAAAAIGLRPAMSALSKRYTKQSIEIRKTLLNFDPSDLQGFRNGWNISKMESLADDIGTEEFTYVNFISDNPAVDVRSAFLFATYYSDPKDKVPHAPDVCYRQAGAIIKKKTTIKLDVPEIQDEPITATLLLMDFKKSNRAVIFFFSAEGKFRNTRGQVRWLIGTPGNKYSYFSKIEAGAAYPTGEDPAQAIELCKKLIRESLPILVNEYLPDKNQLK